jgi:Na+/alanine symporter
LEAKIVLNYADEKSAQAVADAVSPDNFKAPAGLTVKTCREGNAVVTEIVCQGKLAMFTATIDDLLFCISTAERTLKVLRK